MAEIIGVAGSVVSFVGLAGQILQGCQNVHSFLNNVQDASEDFKALKTEMVLFEQTLRDFQHILDLLEASGYRNVCSDPQPALCYCELTVEKLKKLVKKYDTKCRTLSSRISIAWRKKMFEKRVARLQTAAAHVRSVQANIISSLHLDQASLLNALKTDQQVSTGLLISLETGQRASLSLLKDTNFNLEALRDSRIDRFNSQSDNHALLANIKGTNEALHTNTQETVNAIKGTSLVAVEQLQHLKDCVAQQYIHSQNIEQTITTIQSDIANLAGIATAEETKIMSLKMDMQQAFQSLRDDLSTGLQIRPVDARILESTIRAVLGDELRHILSAAASKTSTKVATLTTQDPVSREGHDLINQASKPHERIAFAEGHRTRTQKLRQTRTTRTYRTWIGDITIVSMSTRPLNPYFKSDTEAFTSLSTIVRVIIQSKASFTKKHISGEITWQRSPFGQRSLTVGNLRTWNVVSEDSAIVLACQAGDLSRIMSLFSTRAASPFDCCEPRLSTRSFGEPIYNRSMSILDIVNNTFRSLLIQYSDPTFSDSTESRSHLNEYLNILQLLIDSGVDIGEGRNEFGGPVLTYYSQFDQLIAPSLLPIAAQYVRLVLRESKAEPFFNIDKCPRSECPQSEGLYRESLCRKDVNWAFMIWYGQYAPAESLICSVFLQQENWFIEWPEPEPRCPSTLSGFFHGLYREYSRCETISRDPGCSRLRPLFELLTLAAYNNVKYLGFLAKRLLTRDLVSIDLLVVKVGMRNRLALLFERGLDPRAKPMGLDNDDDFDGTLTEYARSKSALDLWSSALLQSGWMDSDVEVLLEEDLYVSLAYQLFVLESNDFSWLPETLKYIRIYSGDWNDYLDYYNSLDHLRESFDHDHSTCSSLSGDDSETEEDSFGYEYSTSLSSIRDDSEQEESHSQVIVKLGEKDGLIHNVTELGCLASLWTNLWFPSYSFLFKLHGLQYAREAGSVYAAFTWRLTMTAPTRSSDAAVSAMQDHSILRAHRKAATLRDGERQRIRPLNIVDLDPSDLSLDGELTEPIKNSCSTLPRVPGYYVNYFARESGSFYPGFSWQSTKVRFKDAPGLLVFLLRILCLNSLVKRRFMSRGQSDRHYAKPLVIDYGFTFRRDFGSVYADFSWRVVWVRFEPASFTTILLSQINSVLARVWSCWAAQFLEDGTLRPLPGGHVPDEPLKLESFALGSLALGVVD